jgi:hypothetical protein
LASIYKLFNEIKCSLHVDVEVDEGVGALVVGSGLEGEVLVHVDVELDAGLALEGERLVDGGHEVVLLGLRHEVVVGLPSAVVLRLHQSQRLSQALLVSLQIQVLLVVLQQQASVLGGELLARVIVKLDLSLHGELVVGCLCELVSDYVGQVVVEEQLLKGYFIGLKS